MFLRRQHDAPRGRHTAGGTVLIGDAIFRIVVFLPNPGPPCCRPICGNRALGGVMIAALCGYPVDPFRKINPAYMREKAEGPDFIFLERPAFGDSRF